MALLLLAQLMLYLMVALLYLNFEHHFINLSNYYKRKTNKNSLVID